ncbi:MAG: hypothetical protein IKU37_01850 [Candidatus Gastranaerophilales bacterium]|nr:hypothetical protein [Candidatus Gastranaerophilales bacterium]
MKKNKFFYGKHFEALGNIWDGIYGKAEEFAKNQIDKTLNKSRFIFNFKNDSYDIGMYNYRENRWFDIIYYLERHNSKIQIISAAPAFAGIVNKVILKDKYAWENNVEGVFAVETQSANRLILNYYDPFFIENSQNFEFNKVQAITLSGVALSAKKLKEESHVYTEGNYYKHCLKEFLKENPDKTKDDFEPVVVRMQAEHFRMCIGTDEVCTHEIVGLIEDIKYTKILGKKTAILTVNLEHREDNEFFYIYIYVSEHLLKKYKPKIGEGLHARVWLNGYFANEETIEEKSIVLKDFWVLFIILTLFFALEIFSTKTNIYTVKPKPPQIEYKQEQIDFKRIK